MMVRKLIISAAKRTRRRTLNSPGDILDSELAARIAKGDREALGLLLDRHLGPVYGYVMRRLGPGYEELAGRITSNTFEKALPHMKRYAQGRASKPMRFWLIKMAGEHPDLKTAADARGALPAENIESPRLTSLRNAMRTLPRRKHKVLALALFEGLPADEIAAAAGTTPNSAMDILRNALVQVGKSIESSRIESMQAAKVEAVEVVEGEQDV